MLSWIDNSKCLSLKMRIIPQPRFQRVATPSNLLCAARGHHSDIASGKSVPPEPPILQFFNRKRRKTLRLKATACGVRRYTHPEHSAFSSPSELPAHFLNWRAHRIR
jgi:hypothetical protein